MHHRHMMMVVMMDIVVVVGVMMLDDHGVGAGKSGKAEDGKTENEKGFHWVVRVWLLVVVSETTNATRG